MKVSEAKEKVCPFMSNQVGDYVPQFLSVNCICGDCMAWVETHSIQMEGRPETYENTDGYCARVGQ